MGILLSTLFINSFFSFFLICVSPTGEMMTVSDIYGLGNSLNQLNAVSPSHQNGNGSSTFGTVNGITTNIGATTPQQVNGNMQTIPFSQLTPTSMSSGSFGTPAKNFDSLQVKVIFVRSQFCPPTTRPKRDGRLRRIVEMSLHISFQLFFFVL